MLMKHTLEEMFQIGNLETPGTERSLLVVVHNEHNTLSTIISDSIAAVICRYVVHCRADQIAMCKSHTHI